MKAHTTAYKEQIKELGRELGSIITYGETVLGMEELNAVTPSFQSSILKSVMKQLDIDSNVDIPLNTILKYDFGLKVNDEYEYISFGNYIVYKSEKQEDTNSYKITCYDKMLNSMVQYKYLQNGQFPMTIRDYINNLCLDCGLVFKNKNDEFANYDRVLNTDPYAGLEYTYRDIFDELSQVTASTICLDENDEVEIRYINDTNDTIDEEFLKDVNVNFGEKYGKVNSIVLSRSGESDNVYLRDEESVAENGLCELKIIDNQIMNFNDRSDYLQDILDKLNGLEYYLNEFTSTGVTYYDVCDRYNVKVGDNIYPCVMFNDEILVTQGLEENIFTEMPQQTQTDYTKADKTDRKINQAYIIVDKQNQQIELVTKLVQPISNTLTGNGNLTLENAYEGILHNLEIAGNISLIFPSNDLYPSSDLYSLDSYLLVDEEEYHLDFDYLNYINADTCDKYVYQDGKQWIERNVGKDGEGNLYKLEETIIEPKKDIEIFVKSNSVIRLKSFDNVSYKSNYLLQNDYTNTFATQVEVKSEIKQTADEINLEVSKKVNETEVVSTINQSAEEIKITGNRFVVEADNFELTADGKVTATAGDIGGFDLSETSLESKISGVYEYNDYDLKNCLAYLRNYIHNSSIQNYILDLDDSGQVDVLDLLKIQRIIMGEDNSTRNIEAEFKINAENPKQCVSIICNGKTTASLGAGGINADVTNTKSLVVSNYDQTDEAYGIFANGETSELLVIDSNSNTKITPSIIRTPELVQTSLEEHKKNIEKFENALPILKDIDIYKYNLKPEKEGHKKHIGFVIGKNYNYSSEITSVDEQGKEIGVDNYSMTSLCLQAIKELNKKVEELENKIKELESGK